MNKYFNMLLEKNKDLFLEIENILKKYLSTYGYYQESTYFEIEKDKFLKEIEDNESIVVFFDSIYLKRYLISVSLDNNITWAESIKNKEINKVSYSFDDSNKTIKIESISLIHDKENSFIKTSLTEDSIYTETLIKNIEFVFPDGEKIDEDYLSFCISYPEGICINKGCQAYTKCELDNQINISNELTIMNVFTGLYEVNREYLKNFLFDGTPFPPDFIDTLSLTNDISIDKNIERMKKFSLNLNNINFTLTINR